MNSGRKLNQNEDPSPEVFTGLMPDFLRNELLPPPEEVEDELTADILVLKTRNIGNLKFRADDINGMDEETKKTLLSDLQRALGIKPLNK